ncbi:MAG: oligosaccharide flippase family protein [Phycisphaeraceae bacterium]|nr:oligosaccharide flippase family protein [Phycisphaeraceae bacterium]
MTATASSTPLASAPPRSLKRLAVAGSIWTVAGQIGMMVIRLAGNLILSRMLFPKAFGLMVLVGIFMAAIQMFSDFGITQNIIQSDKGDKPDFLNTAWTIGVLRGLALWLATILFAWPFAMFYDEPQLLWLLPAVGATAFITGFQSTALATLNKHLTVGSQTVQMLVAQAVGLLVMIAWAYVDRSVWALVAGAVAVTLVRSILSHFLIPGLRNRFRMDRDSLDSLYSFGRWIFATTVITFLARQLDRIMLGKLVSTEMLGVYGIAVIWSLVPTEMLQKVSHSVIFPLYCKITVAGRDLASEAGRLRRPLLLIGGLTITTLLVGSRDIVSIMYDHRYWDAGPILQAMAFSAWFQILAVNYTPAALALGKSKWLAISHGAKLVVAAAAIPAGYHLGERYMTGCGMIGVVLAVGVAELPKYFALLLPLLRRKLATGLDDLAFSVFILVSSVLGLLTSSALHARDTSKYIVILAALAVAFVVWIPVLWSSWRLLHRRPL